MKRFFVLLIAILSVSCVSCSKKTAEEVVSDEKSWLLEAEITNSDLDSLIRNFSFPEKNGERLAAETEYYEFPAGLVEDLKRAIYTNNAIPALHSMNDGSLIITADDFTYMASDSGHILDSEESLYTDYLNNPADFLIYRCNIELEGDEEIIIFENRPYEDSALNTAHLLKKDGDHYTYAGSDTIGYFRTFAVFLYQDRFYLAVNLDSPHTQTTRALGLYELSDNTSNPMCAVSQNNIYIQISGFECSYYPLYRNEGGLISGELQRYIEEIQTDLIFTDRISSRFVGDENIPVHSPLNGFWQPEGYTRSQAWNKSISGTAVEFSLYRSLSGDTYLLDARADDNGTVVILADYMISSEPELELTEYLDFEDSNLVPVSYQNPDFELAFPEHTQTLLNQFAARVQGNFSYINHRHETIPNNLIVQIEESLFYGNMNKTEADMTDFLADSEEFYNAYEQSLLHDGQTKFNGQLHRLYQYKLEDISYYLVISQNDDSDALVDVNIFKIEEDGRLSQSDSWVSMDPNVELISYQDELYLIESIYRYYSRHIDTAAIYKLSSGKLHDFILISFIPKTYESMEIYSNHESYTREVNAYLKEIQTDLIDKSPVNDNIRVFTGDETAAFDQDRLQRLQSVGGPGTYYEVDFNNDGQQEYIEKHLWFPSQYAPLYLNTSCYQFTEKRIAAASHDFYRGGSRLIQLWFKEIDGKIFTFRLFLADNNYILNVSLINGTEITQVQSHIIVPKCTLSVETTDIK